VSEGTRTPDRLDHNWPQAASSYFAALRLAVRDSTSAVCPQGGRGDNLLLRLVGLMEAARYEPAERLKRRELFVLGAW
jgi:hypothetical protein